MSAICHKAAGVRVVAVCDGSDRAVLHCLSGELVAVASDCELHFSDSGWAFVVQGGSGGNPEQTWCKNLFKLGVFASEQGTYLHDSTNGQVQWLHKSQRQHIGIYPVMSFQGKVIRMATRFLEKPLHGAIQFWDLRPWQEQLQLEVTERFASRWCCQQFKRWHSWLHDQIQMPSSAMQVGSRGKQFDDSISLEMYSVSTFALIYLLLRWQATLATSTSRTQATDLLAAFLSASLPTKFAVPISLVLPDSQPQHCWPTGLEAATCLPLVVNGSIDVGSWASRVPALRQSGISRS